MLGGFVSLATGTPTRCERHSDKKRGRDETAGGAVCALMSDGTHGGFASLAPVKAADADVTNALTVQFDASQPNLSG